MSDSPDKAEVLAYGERVVTGEQEQQKHMRSRRSKVLTVIAGIAAIAVLGGNAARGSEDALPGLEPAATVTYTPYAASPATTAAPTGSTAGKAEAAAKTAGGKAVAAAAKWVVTKVVDGDTIWAARGGETRKIRIIGIDTPEVGQCGYSEASRNLRSIIGGQPVTLTGGARDDADRYGRLLRYVDVNGVDAGLRQVKQGFAIARYDSRDGYGRHTREAAYVQADRSSPKAPCATPATSGNGGGSPATSGGAGTTGSWPLAGDEHPCPQSRPVKGNENSMIAHEPGDRYYGVTNPEQCFATMAAAEVAGFRPAKV